MLNFYDSSNVWSLDNVYLLSSFHYRKKVMRLMCYAHRRSDKANSILSLKSPFWFGGILLESNSTKNDSERVKSLQGIPNTRTHKDSEYLKNTTVIQE